MENHLDMYVFIKIHTQLTTYINMTNHLYEHGKLLRHDSKIFLFSH